jgi:hypothetical protein
VAVVEEQIREEVVEAAVGAGEAEAEEETILSPASWQSIQLRWPRAVRTST